MNIAFVTSPPERDTCRSNWRGPLLAKAIQKTRNASAVVVDASVYLQPDGPAQTVCDQADLLVLEANPHPAVLAAIQRWKARDKTVILDLGPEIYFSRKSAHPESFSAMPGDGFFPATNEMNMIHWGLRLVDAVLLPAQRMIEDIRGFSNGILIPEYIDLDPYLSLGCSPHEGIVLGWKNNSFDASGVLDSGLKAALERLCQVRPEVRVAIFGGDPEIPRQLALPEEKLSYHPLTRPEDWPALLSGVDIGLAPLSGMADERRGWGDVIEFMTMKIPWVASHGPAYYELRPYGWIIENNASTWDRVLLDVIDHLPAYAEEAQGEPYLFAISQGIEENIDIVLSAFNEIQSMSQSLRP